MVVPSLYQKLIKESFFTFDDALKLVKNKNLTKIKLLRLVKRGYVKRVRRGLYQIIPIEFRGKEPPFDKFLLGRKLVNPYYFSHHSALEVHGVANTVIFNTVYISSPKQFKKFHYNGIEYRWVKSEKLFGVQKAIWMDKIIYVSDRERTIIDCIDRIELAGGLEEAFKSLISFPSINPKRLYDYLIAINKRSLFNKVGFFLSLNDVKEKWKINQDFLLMLKRNTGSKVYYFAAKKGEGKLVKEWKIIVPRNLDKMIAYG